MVHVVAAEAQAEEPHQRLRAGDHRGDPLAAVRGVRMPVEVAQVPADPGVDLRAAAPQQRLAEPGEHDPACQVGYRGEADLGGGDELLQRQAGRLSQRLARRPLPEPFPEQRSDHRGVIGPALLREEDPEHRLLEFRRAFEAAVPDAVMGERPGQPLPEHLRQPGALGIEALQVGVEVLAGTVHPAAHG